jgi:hypothetical protein
VYIKDKQRTIIEFLFFDGIGGDEIMRCLYNVYGEDAYSHVTIFCWTKEIRAGNESFRDSGR